MFAASYLYCILNHPKPFQETMVFARNFLHYEWATMEADVGQKGNFVYALRRLLESNEFYSFSQCILRIIIILYDNVRLSYFHRVPAAYSVVHFARFPIIAGHKFFRTLAKQGQYYKLYGERVEKVSLCANLFLEVPSFFSHLDRNSVNDLCLFSFIFDF